MTAKPQPRLDGPDAPYWEGLTRGEVLVQRCGDCGLHRFPASRFCPSCHGDRSDWVAVAPEGAVVSHCVFHKCYFPGFAAEMPYAVVQVRLDSGVQFFSNMVDCPPEAIRTGLRVRGVFEPQPGGAVLLKFAPEDAA